MTKQARSPQPAARKKHAGGFASVILGLAFSACFGSAYAGDWGTISIISSTLGVHGSRLCIGEATRGDVGCPTYAPSLTTAGDVSVTGNLSAAKFIGDGSLLTGVGGAGSSADTIASGTTSIVVQNGGVISITTNGTTANYFNTAGLLVTPGISVTTANGISSTNGYFSGKVGIGTNSPSTLLDVRKDQNASTQIWAHNENTGATAKASVAAVADSAQLLMDAFSTNYAAPYGGNAMVYTGAQDLMLGTDWVNRAVLQHSTGYFGIGGTPQYMLHVISPATGTTVGGNIIAKLQSGASGADATLALSDGVTYVNTISMKGGDILIAPYSGSVGIGTAAPDASAKLEVSTTSQGFLPPRLTEAQIAAIPNPAEGLTVYDTDRKVPVFYDGNGWKLPDLSGNVISRYGYFVATTAQTPTSSFGGLAGGDAFCQAQLTANAWLGKTDSSYSVSGKIRAFLCDNSTCREGMPNTTYKFAVAGPGTTYNSTGGASFTTNASGIGPGDSANWSGSTYLGGFGFLTGRSAGSTTLWGTTHASTCGGWTSTSGSSTRGYSNYTNSSRWSIAGDYCSYGYYLACFVDP